MVTWLGTADPSSAPALERMPLETDLFPALAVRVRHNSHDTVTVVRPGDRGAVGERSFDTPEYHTDAGLLQYSRDQDGHVAISLADGTMATAHDDRLLSVRADHSIVDLCVLYRDGRLELYSSSPPQQLFLSGEPARGAITVRVNGREIRARYDERDRSVSVSRSEWQEASRVQPLVRRATDKRWVEERVAV